jgi:hypothetical protein
MEWILIFCGTYKWSLKSLNTFNIHSNHELDALPSEASSSSLSPDNEKMNKRVKWTHESIQALIELRVQYDKKFKSTFIKKETVEGVSWRHEKQRIQCIFKTLSWQWRYLKSLYTSKKDNQGDWGTGEAPVDFEYFDLMDQFLRKKHNIAPLAIASSIKGHSCNNSFLHVVV